MTRRISASNHRVDPLIAELRNNRVERGLSQAALAKKIGVHGSQLGDWEAARKAPRSDNLIAWANGLGLRLKLELDLPPQSDEAWITAWASEVLR